MASKHLRDAGIDPERVLSSALQAALGENEPAKRPAKRHHPGRVLAAGAAVATAAVVGQKRMPKLVKVPLRMGLHRLEHKLGDAINLDDVSGHVTDLAGSVRDRLAGHDGEPPDDEPGEDEELGEDEGFDDDEGPDDEGPDDEPNDDDGPRGEADDAEPDDEESDEEDDESAPTDDEPVGEQPGDQDEDDDEDEQIAARGDGSNRRRSGGRSPDLFESLLAPRPRPAVMRRAERDVDPAARPPKAGRSKSQKSTTARA